MPTIIRQEGSQVMVFTNDHRPEHVHVFKGGAEAVMTLFPVAIRENQPMSKRDLQKALEIVATNQALLRRAWREIHGDE